MVAAILLAGFCGIAPRIACGEDGYNLWLRYVKVPDAALLARYRSGVTEVVQRIGPEDRSCAVASDELSAGLTGLLDESVPAATTPDRDGAIVLWCVPEWRGKEALSITTGSQGYVIRSARMGGHVVTVIAANSGVGLIYGVFHFLRLMQTERPIEGLDIAEQPKFERRILSHWDTPGGSIERGYAGQSLWQWNELPGKLDPRYRDYARACASIGINGAILNNVNTTSQLLEPDAIRKWAALADVLRPYGIRVYLTAKYSAPMEIGGLKACDPLDPGVREFWKRKADEIRQAIPDFGGFQVKADSEGQPGPRMYGRTEADGANMLAAAVGPGGIVIWRAFIYGRNPDRAPDSYNAFAPLDGEFAGNVVLSVKNGPIDFQPREPFHPLFGAMPRTNIFPELEITQEYMGHDWHLVYLGAEWEQFFGSDTFARGPGSTVARVADGRLFHQSITGIIGVANTGSDRNWCGSDFAQANWYAWGRLAWNPEQSAADIADDWIRMTWSNDPAAVGAIKSMMMGSWETFVRYDLPLGITFLPQTISHYAPDPKSRVRAYGLDAAGIGMDRTAKGDKDIDQYFPRARAQFDEPAYLLWFHHVAWDRKVWTGRTLWEELCAQYAEGVAGARAEAAQWARLSGLIDPERHAAVAARLARQVADAATWRDYCLRFFHTVNHLPLPGDISESGPVGPAPARRDQEP